MVCSTSARGYWQYFFLHLSSPVYTSLHSWRHGALKKARVFMEIIFDTAVRRVPADIYWLSSWIRVSCKVNCARTVRSFSVITVTKSLTVSSPGAEMTVPLVCRQSVLCGSMSEHFMHWTVSYVMSYDVCGLFIEAARIHDDGGWMWMTDGTARIAAPLFDWRFIVRV